MNKLKILNVVGARPNFMKIAPLYEEMLRYPGIDAKIVHTGQHYDKQMSELFFDNLGLPKPHFYLGVGSGGHGEQTGRVMIEFEKVVLAERPDIVLVVGDVNSTIACSLVAVKLGIKVVHVEAGLRSYDRDMPEEVNRVLTDQISDYLFTTERAAADNLAKEGITGDHVIFAGNVMIDSLLHHREKAASSTVLADLGLEPRGYGLITLHRPSNVDDPEVLGRLLDVLGELSARLPLLFPMHPRTRNKIEEFGLQGKVEAAADLRLMEPLGYLDFMKCTDNALFVLTDSGGVQEETTVLGVPCITTRENTERPITATVGTNVVVGRDTARIREEVVRILDGRGKQGETPELWDGHAAERIVGKLWELEGGSADAGAA
ncbi:MAG: UDP-N-acetylglucosamine 2-epimerase (non-hydrolyzing) [Gammaproteobacteria bacterium]|nr:UDP-N-acetylglucosamine 2-epimerase (non-hydrolyzing) [Gammaproteobacteria bacterium]